MLWRFSWSLSRPYNKQGIALEWIVYVEHASHLHWLIYIKLWQKFLWENSLKFVLKGSLDYFWVFHNKLKFSGELHLLFDHSNTVCCHWLLLPIDKSVSVLYGAYECTGLDIVQKPVILAIQKLWHENHTSMPSFGNLVKPPIKTTNRKEVLATGRLTSMRL